MSKRFSKKNRKHDKAPVRKFDPSPLIGNVDLSRKDVKLLLVRMPDHLCQQFEDENRGIVGRMRLNCKPNELRHKASGSKSEAPIQNNSEESPFLARPLDTSFRKLNQQSEGVIFIDKPLPPPVKTTEAEANADAKQQAKQPAGKQPTGKQPPGKQPLGKQLGKHPPGKQLFGKQPPPAKKLPTLNNTKYELLLQPSSTDMAIFSGNSLDENDNMKLEGIVDAQLHARPPMTDAFRKYNKWRTFQLNKAPPKMSIMTETEVKRSDQVALRPNSVNESVREREERKRAKEESRRHLDIKDDVWKEHIQTAIFRAYEIQAYYSADELAETLDEPVNRLRPFISELCQYNKAGPFSQKYELKDEFKTVSQRQLKERVLEQHRLSQLDLQKKRKEEREREREREKAEGVKKKARLN